MKIYFVVFLLFFSYIVPSQAQNPLIRHIYAADPFAHVWPDDPNTLWL